MAGADYKGTLAWTEAMDLALKLTRLSEDLPQPEAEFLARRLREAGLDGLQDVARALASQSAPDFNRLVEVDVVLALVDRTYPALDTAAAEAAWKVMAQRYQGDFAERPAVPLPPPAAAEDSEPELADDDAAAAASERVAVPVAQEDDSVHADHGQ